MYNVGVGAGSTTILFVILKLTGRIKWPWLWVLSPLWGLFAINIIAGLLAGLIG